MKENEKPAPEVQGFNLSQDYELLWKLINNNYRVPGWIKYTTGSLPEHVWYDIVEISKRENKNHRYVIGSRGIGYNSFCGAEDQEPEKTFIQDCTHFNLWFAIPNYKIPLL